MKSILVLVSVVLGLGVQSAQAMYTCSAGPCGDGSSCSVSSGSKTVSCKCQEPFFGGDTYASCTTGIVVVKYGEAPVLDATEWTATLVPNATVFKVSKSVKATSPGSTTIPSNVK